MTLLSSPIYFVLFVHSNSSNCWVLQKCVKVSIRRQVTFHLLTSRSIPAQELAVRLGGIWGMGHVKRNATLSFSIQSGRGAKTPSKTGDKPCRAPASDSFGQRHWHRSISGCALESEELCRSFLKLIRLPRTREVWRSDVTILFCQHFAKPLVSLTPPWDPCFAATCLEDKKENGRHMTFWGANSADSVFRSPWKAMDQPRSSAFKRHISIWRLDIAGKQPMKWNPWRAWGGSLLDVFGPFFVWAQCISHMRITVSLKFLMSQAVAFTRLETATIRALCNIVLQLAQRFSRDPSQGKHGWSDFLVFLACFLCKLSWCP